MATSTTHEVDADAAEELLLDLVETPSPSGEEDAAAERLIAFFEAHDREVFRDEVGNVRAPADDSVLLTSHVDTVPGEIPVRVEDDPADEVLSDRDAADEDTRVLWGRGSVDATGPLAAMAVAAVETGVSFVGVMQEETDSAGAHFLVEDRDAPGAVVNGEPSGWDGITLGYRGLIAGTYVATSESGHTSRPEPNAIEHATSWWAAVREAVSEVGGDEFDPVFEQVTAKPVSIDGGTSEDGLSVEATMDVQLRIPPALDAGSLRELADGELDLGTVNWGTPIPPVMESPRTPVARALRGAIRRSEGDPRLLRKTGTSDMNVFAREWDCPMATYGPGDSDLDHAPDERLPLAEYHRAIAVLTDAAADLAEGDAA
ncbi:acetyl-lysine deacetylase [Salinarchaeum sp. Harcht-Bsk1]|uniref:[LysW]-lysine hydrolase n=1 Tax=Salinarchaeum sp. Harcht-Bsk1 TaxID=1333523 RepID=UPI000342411D|nr:[LysW]-lysine hydrolase [Salinarchaeum sp. Harcht-Bsk1]AGN01526.1 acetyl-lysine deacetylase [Salinarchaeum sp. Harcht-Bsk1]